MAMQLVGTTSAYFLHLLLPVLASVCFNPQLEAVKQDQHLFVSLAEQRNVIQTFLKQKTPVCIRRCAKLLVFLNSFLFSRFIAI